MNAWLALVMAGVFEIGFTTFMKLSAGFTKPVYVALFLASATLSFAMLATAMKSVPLGTAYAVWTGIGAVGTVVVGIFLFGEAASLPRVAFLTLLVGSIVGLKLVTPS